MADLSLRADSVRINPITSTSRRGALGAFAALSAVAATPALASVTTPRTAWEAALAKLEHAEATYQAFSENIWRPACRSNDADPSRDISAVHEECDRLLTAYCDARSAVMAEPAPDLAALRWKLDEAVQVEEDELISWDLKYVSQTIADFKRLLPDGGWTPPV